MPRARNRFDRSVQTLRWLQSEWDFPKPLGLRWVDRIKPDRDSPHGYHGYCTEEKGRLVIYLCAASNRTRSAAVESTIHEAAHAYLWGEGLGLLHGPRYWQVYGEMMDAWDHHGHMDSASFEVD